MFSSYNAKNMIKHLIEGSKKYIELNCRAEWVFNSLSSIFEESVIWKTKDMLQILFIDNFMDLFMHSFRDLVSKICY